jgi:predicted porin
MKKSLIALAALSAFATAAQAQSSVSVYGIIDTGYNSLEQTTSAGVKTTATSVTTNGEAATSRLGFRGTEDLGGGVKANFVIESTIGQAGLATGTVVGNRLFFVGLEDAKLGQLRIGLQNTVNRDVFLAHDQLAAANVVGNLSHNNAGVPNGTSTTDGAASAAAGAHTPFTTAINYLSPRMSGVQVTLGMTQSNVEDSSKTTKAKTGSGTQAGLNYQVGKLSASVAYSERTTATNAVAGVLGGCFVTATGVLDTATADACASTATRVTGSNPVAASDVKTKDTSAGASYNLGFATVGYIYNKTDANNSINGATLSNVDRTSHAFSASIPMGAKLVGRVGYGFGEYRNGANTIYNGDVKGMQAALNYNLSKRTMAYAIYGDESREISATAKAKAQEYSVGVRHSF